MAGNGTACALPPPRDCNGHGELDASGCDCTCADGYASDLANYLVPQWCVATGTAPDGRPGISPSPPAGGGGGAGGGATGAPAADAGRPGTGFWSTRLAIGAGACCLLLALACCAWCCVRARRRRARRAQRKRKRAARRRQRSGRARARSRNSERGSSSSGGGSGSDETDSDASGSDASSAERGRGRGRGRGTPRRPCSASRAGRPAWRAEREPPWEARAGAGEVEAERGWRSHQARGAAQQHDRKRARLLPEPEAPRWPPAPPHAAARRFASSPGARRAASGAGGLSDGEGDARYGRPPPPRRAPPDWRAVPAARRPPPLFAAAARRPPMASLSLKLQDATADVERLGELFLINREQMVATDRARNATREALTALRKAHREPKAWLKTSAVTFRRCTTPGAVAALEGEASRLEAAMAALRAEQKRLVALLADRGATPTGLEDGMLRAMLQLRG
ncbi:hypothetical protein HT031_002488 [Scenedesmus sp. PABB004]|nr:hypothetical protein HT031_002488 [Scenedesmus sp. PABB004]